MDMEGKPDRDIGQDKVSRMIDFLVANRAYPMFSKKGKVFFRKPKISPIPDEKAREIIDQLNLKTAEECRRIREIVKERLDQQRTIGLSTAGSKKKDHGRCSTSMAPQGFLCQNLWR